MKLSGSISGTLAKTHRVILNSFAPLFFVILLVSTITFSTFSLIGRSGGTPDPTELVKAMSNALRTLTYTGTLVAVSKDRVDAMRITHVNDGEFINEQLTSLIGEAREIFRNNYFVTCIWPNSQSVINMKAKKQNQL